MEHDDQQCIKHQICGGTIVSYSFKQTHADHEVAWHGRWDS